MTDIFDLLGTQPLWISVIVLTLAYFIVTLGTKAFLKPAIVGFVDPLNIQLLLFIGPALMGILLTPYFTRNYSESYFLIVFFLAVWLIIIRLAGKPRKIDLRDRMSADFQIALLSLSLLFIILNVVVNMIIPGKIPLFTEGGVYSRFDATQNSRLMSWFSLGVSPMPGLIFAVTQKARVRKFAVIAVVIQTAAGLLFANKGAVVTVLFILLNSMFVAKVRGEAAKYKSLYKLFLYSGVAVACVIPFYFSIIGFGANQTVLSELGIRFLGGFDQLILTSQFDLLRGAAFRSLIHVNLIEYQFMPLFKAALSAKYEYSTVGQYVLEVVHGIVIDGTFTFPNSNLILETTMTSGTYLGLLAFILEIAGFYWCRFIALKKAITPLSLVLMYGMVFSPFGLFLSGQEWFTEVIVMFSTVILATIVAVLWTSTRNALKSAPAGHPRPRVASSSR